MQAGESLHQQALKELRAYLVDNVTVLEVIDYIIEVDGLTPDEKDQIDATQTSRGKMRLLLDYLQKKNEVVFNAMMKGLNANKCDHVVEALDAKIVSIKQQQKLDSMPVPNRGQQGNIAMERATGAGRDCAASAQAILPTAPSPIYFVNVNDYHDHEAVPKLPGGLTWKIPYEKCWKVAEQMDSNDHDWKMLASKLGIDEAIDEVEHQSKIKRESPTILLLRVWMNNHRKVDGTTLYERLVQALRALRRIDIVDEMAELNIKDD